MSRVIWNISEDIIGDYLSVQLTEESIPSCLPLDLERTTKILTCGDGPTVAIVCPYEMASLALNYEAYQERAGEIPCLPNRIWFYSIPRADLSHRILMTMLTRKVGLAVEESGKHTGYLVPIQVFNELSRVQIKHKAVDWPSSWVERLPEEGSPRERAEARLINELLPKHFSLAMPATVPMKGQLFLRNIESRDFLDSRHLPVHCMRYEQEFTEALEDLVGPRRMNRLFPFLKPGLKSLLMGAALRMKQGPGQSQQRAAA